jgi:hypothetical protein
MKKFDIETVRSFSADGVEITLAQNVLFVAIDGNIEIETRMNDDGWLLYDRDTFESIEDDIYPIQLETLKDAWLFIEDLAIHYNLFPKKWIDEHYKPMYCLFEGVL